ncbi:MAG: hypothetical protein GKR97_09130 [Rhizobiaceae bacterium]|nr:hypothetical protein [Rhizobiaceae bacterium]
MNVEHNPLINFVIVSCLILLASCSYESSSPPKYDGDMVLAISWQAGFCETRPRLPECRSQTTRRYDANHFSLHGLWPQPRNQSYCNVDASQKRLDTSRKWSRLTGLGLSEELQNELLKIMPGARSFLHRHEWIKHGTCYSADAETYFHDSLLLMNKINNSPLRDLFASSIGKQLTGRQIRKVVNASFGKGAGQRVRIACKRDGRRTIITELTIGLRGEITEQMPLSDLIQAAPQTRPGCPAGIVDAVGLQ